MNPLILIVDDHEPNRESLREILANQKYHFCEAVDGPSALQIAQETPPDLVLLDVMMPGMDGYEVCRRLRADDQLAEVPIVLVTALDDMASRLRGIKAGADDFVSKPLNGTELRARVRTITRLNRYRRLMNADADLLKSKLRLRAMAENSEDVFRLYTLNPLKVDYLSPSSESVWGYHPDRYCENPDIWLQQIHPDDHPRVDSAFAAIVSNQTSHFAEEYRIVHPDRSVRWISDHGTAIHDENRVLIGFGSVARDITARKEAEEKLLRAQRIESLGMLAAGIAHDFNNALAPVLMSGEMLGQYVSDPKGQKMLNNMNNGAKRGAGLVKQLLAFTRGSGGDKVPLQLRHILQELGDQAESIFPKDIRVRMHVPVDLALVAGIPTQIHQIFLNLFVNARDAMPSGGLLRVEATNCVLKEDELTDQPETNPGRYVRTDVSDTGTGIPAEILGKIWQPFFTTKGEGKGTGLGLSTVHGIIETHHGFVRLNTQLGEGTCFSVYLPVAE